MQRRTAGEVRTQALDAALVDLDRIVALANQRIRTPDDAARVTRVEALLADLRSGDVAIVYGGPHVRPGD